MYVQERPGGPGTQVLTMRRFLIAIASLAVLPAIASAQRGGMGAGMARPAMAAPAPHVAMHAAPPVGAHATSQANPGNTLRFGDAVCAHPFRCDCCSPYSALDCSSATRWLRAAICFRRTWCQAWGLITHTSRQSIRMEFMTEIRNRPFVGTFIPFFYGGGYYMPFSSDDYVDEAPDRRATSRYRTASKRSRSRYYETRSARAVARLRPGATDGAEKEAEQYVFVRRDGTVFFASAYAWQNGTLRYITSEGLRHTVTADKLDLDATQQFNEQRGLNFRSPV